MSTELTQSYDYTGETPSGAAPRRRAGKVHKRGVSLEQFHTIDVNRSRANGRYGANQEPGAQPEGSFGNQKNSQLFRSRLGSRGASNSRNGSRPSRGTRALHYNEDDAFNQSYVERVLQNSQQQYPQQHGKGQLNAATPSASRSMDLREAAEESKVDVNINSRLDKAFVASQTPASHLGQ